LPLTLLPLLLPPFYLQVLREIDNATKAFPNAYIRMCAFDANRQVQVASMLVHRPSSAKEWKPVNQRQVSALLGMDVACWCC
jgi:ribulose bisphosphate carboxylase small subunit